MSRTLVMGDVHGNYNALCEAMTNCEFDYDNDQLVILGDVVDGHLKTKECVELLLGVKNRILLMGNHDYWFVKFLETGGVEPYWYHQGGRETLHSYDVKIVGYNEFIPDQPIVQLKENEKRIPQSHKDFFSEAMYYYVDDKNRLFVHGGINDMLPMEQQDKKTLLWDRSLIQDARWRPIRMFNHVFIGHTTTEMFGHDPDIEDCLVPLTFNNLTMMDTGAGGAGRLSIMDVDTRIIWQSDW